MALRRTPTASTFGCTPLSKDSLQVPFLDSPVHSPGLPSIVPRHGKKPTPRWRRRRLRLLAWVVGGFTLLRLVICISRKAERPIVSNFGSSAGDSFEIIGADILPDQPVALSIIDTNGKQRWTISIPSEMGFPLSLSDYRGLCVQSDEIARLVANSMGFTNRLQAAPSDFYYKDPYYMDIATAEREGFLPDAANQGGYETSQNLAGALDDLHSELRSGRSIETKTKICESSLTYILQTDDAGFGKTLMGLWMSYGLAQEEGRAFFVDDFGWEYGQYITYFKPPPRPDCQPPPGPQRVPCPHEARHLVVSSATIPWAFGASFKAYFEEVDAAGATRQRRIFFLLRAGFEALFHLVHDDEVYLKKRIEELDASIHKDGGILVGIHVRHGDLHPMEFQYQKAYIPLQKYADAASILIEATFPSNPGKEGVADALRSSKFLVASDDPDVYEAAELKCAEKAQNHVPLASKSTLDVAGASREQAGQFINSGWEGGFFRNLFWSLGSRAEFRTAGNPSPAKMDPSRDLGIRENARVTNPHKHLSVEAQKLRELVGRAYLLDLAVLGHSDKVVCGISSITCRLLAVMMGWEKAHLEAGWRNIDGSWDWFGMNP